MKSGTYRVSFVVELRNCGSKEEAEQAVGEMVSDACDVDEFPEVNFEMIEELDIEYNSDELELEELSFEEA
jgi:hypothetical protein